MLPLEADSIVAFRSLNFPKSFLLATTATAADSVLDADVKDVLADVMRFR